jgi:chromate reductase, NAD(P)H dehydrogenase (quinone)
MKIRILACSGSSRQDSVNARLLGVAIETATALGAEVTRLDLRTLALPLYDGDLEATAGLPEACLALKRTLIEHHALLIAAPEYNGFFTPLLKNAIDWASRPQKGQPSPFAGKIAALLAASPGALGGIRGLAATRLLLTNLGVLVTPTQMALPVAHEAFDAAGRLRGAAQKDLLDKVVRELLETTLALQAKR